MTNAILTSPLVLAACRLQWLRFKQSGAIRAALLAASVLISAPAEPVRAEEAAPAPAAASERSIKAAFLYKFLDYAEWPDSAFAQPDSPLVIGVTGADDIAAELQQITAGRKVGSRPVSVRRVREADSLAGLHMLFIGRSESARLASLAHRARDRAVLTVTEIPGALEHGAIVNFVLVEGRVRFEIALDNAERSGVKLSSRLLAVAITVRTAQ